MAKAGLAGLLGCALLLSSCGEVSEPGPISPVEQELADVSQTFGFDLLNRLIAASPGQNVFVSPLSVSMSVGMAHYGARGDTAAGIREALGLGDLDREEVNTGYRELLDRISDADDGVTLEVGNSIWYAADFTVDGDFIAASEAAFDAVVRGVSFAAGGVVEQINAWVAEVTGGEIDEIVSAVDPSTVMFLVNAVYFEGEWSDRFSKANTEPTPFYLANGASTTVDMMRQTRDRPYVDRTDFQAVRLDYGEGRFAMVVILPDEGTDADVVAAELDAGVWEGLIDGLRSEEVDLGLPRFELECATDLRPALTALGMADAFAGERADFSGITPGGGLVLDRVDHKAICRVDEEGTVAAAATSTSVVYTSWTPPKDFIVDRPFLFAIYHLETGALLFVGKVERVPGAGLTPPDPTYQPGPGL